MHILRDRLLTDQQALSFLVNQATTIEREVNRQDYPDIQYPALIPVDFNAPDWAKSVTYFSMDRVGAAKWFSAQANDVPKADVNMNRLETHVSMAAIGYGYDIEELSQAAALGIPLDTEKADAARRAYEEFMDRALIFGAPEKGYVGLVNDGTITAGTAPNGAGGSPLWAQKSSDEKLADVNLIISGVYTGTATTEMADTVLLPIQRMLSIATTGRATGSDTTILNFLREANAYSSVTGRPLTIRGVRGLETAGAGGTARMVAYRNDKKVLKADISIH